MKGTKIGLHKCRSIDDYAFEAVLSFVNERVALDAIIEATGGVGEDVGGELYCDEQEMPMQEGTQLKSRMVQHCAGFAGCRRSRQEVVAVWV